MDSEAPIGRMAGGRGPICGIVASTPLRLLLQNPHRADAESLRLELQDATTAFRHQLALLIQAFGVLVTADSALVAYGFTQRQSGILLVASGVPIFILMIYFGIMAGLTPIA